MGIKFHCANGHKIHVKAFLAGHRGICPKCGVKVDIPLESEAEFSSREAAGRPIEAEESGDITLGLVEEHVVPKSRAARQGDWATGPADSISGGEVAGGQRTAPARQPISNVDDILSAYLTGDAASATPLLSKSRSLSSKASAGVALLVIALVLAIALLFVLFGRHEPPADAKQSATARSRTVAMAQSAGRIDTSLDASTGFIRRFAVKMPASFS
jgi:hypothetical protein